MKNVFVTIFFIMYPRKIPFWTPFYQPHNFVTNSMIIYTNTNLTLGIGMHTCCSITVALIISTWMCSVFEVVPWTKYRFAIAIFCYITFRFWFSYNELNKNEYYCYITEFITFYTSFLTAKYNAYLLRFL